MEITGYGITTLMLLALASPSLAVESGDICTNIIQHGIYDYFRSIDVRDNASKMDKAICDKYESLKSSNLSGSANVDIFFAGGGSASMTKSELEQTAKLICSKESAESSAKAVVDNASRIIDPHAVQAWRDCTTQYLISTGLKAKTEFREEDQKYVAISVRYITPEGNPAGQQVKNIILDPPSAFGCKDDKLESCSGCRGDLWDQTRKREAANLGSAYLTVACARSFPSTPVAIGDTKFIAPAATIQVHTTAGDVVRHLAAVPVAPPPAPLPAVPAGTVVAFGGDESKVPQGWLLCNGLAISRLKCQALFNAIGTAHGEGDGSSTFNLPDYRGRFLRGVDGESGRDPDHGKRPAAAKGGNENNKVGSIQEDLVGKHTHGIKMTRLAAAGDARGVPQDEVHAANTEENTQKDGSVAEETRPKNSYVYWIIKY